MNKEILTDTSNFYAYYKMYEPSYQECRQTDNLNCATYAQSYRIDNINILNSLSENIPIVFYIISFIDTRHF